MACVARHGGQVIRNRKKIEFLAALAALALVYVAAAWPYPQELWRIEDLFDELRAAWGKWVP
jgi:hypothetical protein